MASFATQVQIRRGTEAENDAFTGAEGEVTMDLTNKQLRVHDGQTTGGMKIPNIKTVFGTNQIANNAVTEEKIADNAVTGGKIADGAITESKLSADLQTKINEKTSGAGRNIGDIFWTTRTDSALNGAVEANGAQYNFADVNQGQNNVQALLESGALPSVSISEFDAKVASDGGCDSFGYGTDTLWSRWSKQANDFVYTKTASYEVGDPVYDAPGGNIIGNITETGQGYPMTYTDTNGAASYNTMFVGYVSGPVDSTPYFKVPKKVGRVLVRSQEPTEDNDYTWYNVYSDGWVEQGGKKTTVTNNADYVVTFPVEMAELNYTYTLGQSLTTADIWNERHAMADFSSKTTTGISIKNARFSGGTAASMEICWQVSGYADPAEYTKDKWDYQNVQVERPMVQLFNSATDEAVAQCTEVLSDVAGLKQTTDGMIDYVVESQDPTEANGYTWYRLYKSGWVEQGGILQEHSIQAGDAGDQTLTLPIEMADTNYTVTFGAVDGKEAYQSATISRTTTGGTVTQMNRASSASFVIQFSYIVSGMSAQGA